MTADSLNKNFNIKYDYRNLIIQLKHKVLSEAETVDTFKYVTNYLYDEAGNRIRKSVYKFIGTTYAQEIAQDFENDSLWEAYNDEVYSRDVSGKELAIYKNGDILEYPVYGLDLIGKIKNSEMFYYFKDHLGSVRATVNTSGDVVSSQDYDAWGYLLQDRVYVSDGSKFKFTGKERDEESEYDYFGARYYDARIGRWGQTEPLLDKYPGLTPYNYSVDNPLRVVDPNGADPFEIIVRTYIPFDVVIPGFKVDSRGADPNSSNYRTEQRITIETDRSVSSNIITNYSANISPSILYLPTSPMPTILSGMGEGNFNALASYSSDVNGGNNASVELTGSAHVGVIPSFLLPEIAAIDYSFGITILPQKDGSVQVSLSGEHDKFPAYEIYIKDKSGKVTPIYNQSPVDPIFGPRNLFPYPIGGKANVNSEQVIP